MSVGEKRSYELSTREYALLQDVRTRLGPLAAAEVECILGRSLKNFYNTPEDQIRIIQSLAAVRGVKLPT